MAPDKTIPFGPPSTVRPTPNHTVVKDTGEHSVNKVLTDIGRDHALRVEQVADSAEAHMREVRLGDVVLKTLNPLEAMDLLRRNISTPALPEVLLQLFNVMSARKCTFEDVADVVETDPALTGTVLRIANSAAYGLAGEVRSVTQAVSVVGLKELSAMALGTTYLAQLKPNPDIPFDLDRFWQHSLATATVAQVVAKTINTFRPEQYYLGGLLHDIGRLALYANIKGLAESAEFLCKEQRMSLHEVEEQCLGFDHAHFGGTLLHSWGLPKGLVEMVHKHHDPMSAPREQVEIIHVADVLATILGYSPCEVAAPPRLVPAAWDRLGIPANQLTALVDHVVPILDSTFKILSGVSALWSKAA